MEPTGWRTHLTQSLAQDRGRGVVVAVSGGSDSVGLLCMLRDFDLRLSVAHLNHGTRGAAARADAEAVARLAESLSLPFDLGHWQPTRPAHFEADARNARYQWLVEIAAKRGSELVAVGHTSDDQAETILHRILRGTGLRGLAGIPRRRRLADGITLIRPLLDISRQEIREHLASIGRTFRDDETNRDLGRTRNRLRHDLLPKLESQYNPAVRDALIRLATISEGWDSHLDTLADSATLHADVDSLILRPERLRPLASAMRAEVLRRVWRRARWPEREMDSTTWLRLAASLDEEPSKFAIAGRIEVRVSSETFTMTRLILAAEPSHPAVTLTIPGAVLWGKTRIIASLEPRDGGEAIDFDRIRGEVLTVRGAVDGDRFQPLGLGGRSQPLNDFFRGSGVVKGDRQSIPIVCDDDGILWVVGHRIAERVKRTEETRRVLSLEA